MKTSFETVTVKRNILVEETSMEISAFIAGVNSGVYGLPFVITVRTWARKWWFKKFFYAEACLDLKDVKRLRAECDKVIKFCEAEKRITTPKPKR